MLSAPMFAAAAEKRSCGRYCKRLVAASSGSPLVFPTGDWPHSETEDFAF
jgi:hypothetical protein